MQMQILNLRGVRINNLQLYEQFGRGSNLFASTLQTNAFLFVFVLLLVKALAMSTV